jgi:hypothetical protein
MVLDYKPGGADAVFWLDAKACESTRQLKSIVDRDCQKRSSNSTSAYARRLKCEDFLKSDSHMCGKGSSDEQLKRHEFRQSVTSPMYAGIGLEPRWYVGDEFWS